MAATTGAKRHPLGVLFVHGIGSQKRGDTLLAFGEPVRSWLEEWLAGSCRPGLDTSSVTLAGTTLRRPTADTPAHTLLRAQRTRSDGQHTASEWLLAESWWAEDFPTPSFRALAVWSLAVGPWMAQRHFNLRFVRGASIGEGLQQELRTFRTAVTTNLPPSPDVQLIGRQVAFLLAYLLVPTRRVCAALLAFIVGLIAQVLIAALLVVGVVPTLRRLVLRIQKKVSESVGDSYALVAQPLAFDSMVSRVERDLDWLLERCDRVAVVAHSQGAAIAHRAVKNRPVGDVSLLVTFGAGIVKLTVLRRLELGRAARSFAIRLAAVGALITGAAVVGGSPIFGAALGLLAVLLLIGAAKERPQPDATPIASELDLPGLGVEGGIRWVDLYGSSDPVPEGTLANPPRVGLISQHVYNRRSTFSDHTTYWRNAEGFVARVSTELARVAEWNEFRRLTRDDGRVGPTAAAMRADRTDVLSFGRWVAIVAAVAATVGFGIEGLRAIADACVNALGSVPGAGRVEHALSRLSSREVGAVGLGAVVVALAVAVAYAALFLPAWRAWDTRARRAMFHRALGPDGVPLGPRLALSVLLLGWIPVGLWVVDAGWGPAAVYTAAGCGLVAFIIWSPSQNPLDVGNAALYVCNRSNLEPWADLPLPKPRYIYTQYLGLVTDSEAAWVCCGPAGTLSWIALGTGARYDIELSATPKAVELGGTRVWVTTDDSLVEIDTAAKSIVARHPLEPGLEGLAVSEDAIWVAAAGSSTVLRVLPSTGRVVAVVPVAARPFGIASHHGSVWVVGRPSGTLSQIDPLQNKVVAEIDLRAVPFGRPVATPTAICVYDLQGTLVRVDLESYAVTKLTPATRSTIGGIAARDGEVWLVDGWGKRAFEVVDGERTRELPLPRRGQEIAITDQWVCVATYA